MTAFVLFLLLWLLCTTGGAALWKFPLVFLIAVATVVWFACFVQEDAIDSERSKAYKFYSRLEKITHIDRYYLVKGTLLLLVSIFATYFAIM